MVQDAVNAIASEPVGKRVLSTCQRLGFNTLRRYARAAPVNTATVSAEPAAGLHRDRFVAAIDINDAYFEYKGARDRFSGTPGYSIAAQVLLHEAFHAVDRYSPGAEFRRIVGFADAGARARFTVASAADAQASPTTIASSASCCSQETVSVSGTLTGGLP